MYVCVPRLEVTEETQRLTHETCAELVLNHTADKKRQIEIVIHCFLSALFTLVADKTFVLGANFEKVTGLEQQRRRRRRGLLGFRGAFFYPKEKKNWVMKQFRHLAISVETSV